MKAKNRVWRAVVVDVKPEAPPKPKKRKTAAAVMTSDVVLASFPPHEGDPVTQPSTTTPSTHTPDIQLSYDTPLSPVSILKDFDLYNNFYTYDEPAPSQQLDRIEAFLRAFQSEVFSRLDRLEASVQSQRQVSTPCVPHPTNSLPLRPPLADVNSQQVSAATDAKIQALLVNPRITGPVHLASELAKLIFTEKEMAACTLTGRKINGQCRQMLDSGKMCLIEHLVQQKFSMGEAEFASVRSGIRDSLANRCKYLRLKLAPRNIDII